MPEPEKMKMKICLVGSGGVGKTSLIRKFVFEEFNDAYITTIGTKITRKELKLKHPSTNGEIEVNMLIWDIMGQKGFRQLLQEAYFFGAQGVIAVCDITNKESLKEIDGWVDSAFSVAGDVPVVFLANKIDLKDKATFDFDELKKIASRYENSITFSSSAKTGENVEEIFQKLSAEILNKL
jgi:small GTP-binding protein